MRFLMLNWRDPYNPTAGGAERAGLGYMTELVARGHEVVWFSNTFSGAPPEAVSNGIQIVRGGGLGTSVFKAWRWYQGQKHFHLVIDQHHGIPWFAPWWCRTNCVAYIHEVLGPIWNAFYPWPLNVIGRWQERWTVRLYRNIPFWTVSDSTRKALERSGARQVKVIPNGTATIALPVLDPKELRLPVELIVVSRLAANKRIDHSIRVASCLAHQGIDVKLTVVGTGECEQSLRELSRSLGIEERVTFTGQLPEGEKDKLLRQAHFLVHTSIREGWGLNVIEANALGTPAVVYPVAGLVDSTIDGETGLVAAMEQPEAVADRIREALDSPEKYQRFRDNAWQRAKTFHWSAVLPKACEWLEAQARAGNREAT